MKDFTYPGKPGRGLSVQGFPGKNHGLNLGLDFLGKSQGDLAQPDRPTLVILAHKKNPAMPSFFVFGNACHEILSFLARPASAFGPDLRDVDRSTSGWPF